MLHSREPSTSSSPLADSITAGVPAIDLRQVVLRRGDTTILKGVDWTVPAGACAAILGPNGSGKSTLTRILACHLWPTSGRAAVLGQQFGDANLIQLRRSIRLVQAAGPFDVDPALTAHQVVLTGFFSTIGLYDPVTPPMEAEAARLLRQVGLAHVAAHAYGTLSSGERVRNLIARALAIKPRLLLLDEPTAGLDLLAREQVLATVQRMFQADAEGDDEPRSASEDGSDRGNGGESGNTPARGAALASPPTVIFITHHVEELPPATSHVLLLDDGRAAASGPPGEVLRAEVLSPVYRCPLEVRRANGRFYIEVHPSAWQSLLS